LDEGAAQIFTTALFDEGPDLDQLPSKLWTSRNDFQASRACVTPPSSMHPSSAIQSLTDAVHRLAISPSPSLTEQFQGLHLSETPPSPSRLIERNQKLNISEIPALAASCSTDGMSGQGVHQSRRAVSNEITNKKDCSQFTQSALHIIDSVEAHLQQCSGKLAAVPTIAVLQEVRTIVSRSREALEKITRRTPRLDARKSDVTQLLRNVEGQLLELDTVSQNEPLIYPTGKIFLSTSYLA
jgi:hypothetical protein